MAATSSPWPSRSSSLAGAPIDPTRRSVGKIEELLIGEGGEGHGRNQRCEQSPNERAAEAAHREARGPVADEITEVEEGRKP
jgi:hypothetical protein